MQRIQDMVRTDYRQRAGHPQRHDDREGDSHILRNDHLPRDDAGRCCGRSHPLHDILYHGKTQLEGNQGLIQIFFKFSAAFSRTLS